MVLLCNTPLVSAISYVGFFAKNLIRRIKSGLEEASSLLRICICTTRQSKQ